MAKTKNLKVYTLDSVGVVVDSNAINNQPGALTKAQNAVPDPIGEKGSIRKRPGLKPFNDTAGSGSVQGGTSVPITLGAAGPNFVNPFSDSNITLIPRQTFTLPVRQGPTFNDTSLWQDYDFNFDFSDIEYDFALPEYDTDSVPDLFDITTDTLPFGAWFDETVELPAAPTIIPYNFALGTGATDRYVSVEQTMAQHTSYPSNFLGQQPAAAGLFWPFGAFRSASTNLYQFHANNAAISVSLTGVPSVSLNNQIYYCVTSGGYQWVRCYRGYTDNFSFNANAGSGTIGKNINSLLAADGKIYATVWESGTTTANTGVGCVYEYDPLTNTKTKLGANFTADQIPHSLCWAYGRLWTGTASNAASGKVYWFRPGIDTSWTLDTTFAAGEGQVTSLAIFQGKLYAAILNRTLAGSGKVYGRATDGTWTASDSGTVDTDGGHLSARGYISMAVWPPEDSGLASPTSALYANRNGMTEDTWPNIGIRKFTGSAWSTAATISATGGGGTLQPIFAVNSANRIVPVLSVMAGTGCINTPDGTTWTSRSAQLTITTIAQFPTFFAQVGGSNGVQF